MAADVTGAHSGRTRRLLLVIPVNADQYNEALKGFVGQVLAPDFALDVRNITQGQPLIASRWDVLENGYHVARLVHELAGKGQYDGIFISDFDGAGVEASRELVRVPVLDGFLPQCTAALSLARTFSIIAPENSLVSLDISHPRLIGAAEAMASVRALSKPLEDLTDHDENVALVYESAVEAISNDGALSIILGCTGLIGVAGPVSAMLKEKKGWDVPVTEPNLCGVSYLQTLVRTGLVQSGVSYEFPKSLEEK